MIDVVEILAGREIVFDEILFIVDADEQTKRASKYEIVFHLKTKLESLILLGCCVSHATLCQELLQMSKLVIFSFLDVIEDVSHRDSSLELV